MTPSRSCSTGRLRPPQQRQLRPRWPREGPPVTRQEPTRRVAAHLSPRAWRTGLAGLCGS
jgi:hypothetical protein